MKSSLVVFPILLSSLLPGEVLVEWSSDGEEVDFQSDGVTELDGQFEFVLGTFEGLTPNRSNLAEWESAFRVLGSTDYRPSLQRFFATVPLTSNAPPFALGARAYVWGRNGTGSGSEWVLYGKPEWTFPDANFIGLPPLPTRWRAAAVTNDDVIVGQANGDGFQIRTEKITYTLSYEDWAKSNFDQGDNQSPEADLENDGRSNFLEYALGSDPKSADGPFLTNLSPELELEWQRAPGREVNWVLQESDHLRVFIDREGGYEVVVNEPDRLVLLISQEAEGARFFRVEARPPN